MTKIFLEFEHENGNKILLERVELFTEKNILKPQWRLSYKSKDSDNRVFATWDIRVKSAHIKAFIDAKNALDFVNFS